ncbi:MAG: adenosylmethionine decarboxylase [Gammaproteobacteria bacterium]|nr:MAG: adenosylmethionine decarboxylase [Gammaproteobacteria bacterium]
MQSNSNSVQRDSAIVAAKEKYRCESILRDINKCQLGRHLIVDYWDCDADLLNDAAALCALINEAAYAAGATVMSTHSHQFGHQGVTAIAILAESHISIHTWPETRYAGVDIYTCGGCDPLLAHETLLKTLSAHRSEIVKLTRGKADSPNSIAVVSDEPPLHTGLDADGTWFREDTVPGCRYGNVSHGFNISELVHKGHTRFQEYLIFDNPVYGRVLVLDGIVQFSTSDEFIYHEMLIHPAMFTHPNPRRVVIAGGGDGGALREVLRHNPEEVIMIDIDEQFVRAAAKHLPSLNAGAFEDPRVTLLFEDASEALLRYEGAFDVAIIDCNDAVGPSEALFEEDFYTTVARSLADDGICAVQAGSMLDEEFLRQTHRRMTNQLGRTTGFKLTMPSYHCGEYVFMLASRSCDPAGPDTSTLAELQARRGIVTKHWSPEIHHASQVLPPRFQLW